MGTPTFSFCVSRDASDVAGVEAEEEPVELLDPPLEEATVGRAGGRLGWSPSEERDAIESRLSSEARVTFRGRAMGSLEEVMLGGEDVKRRR